MIHAYSQRLLPPFSGFVQIAESERARAQSLDGVNWEILYQASDDPSARKQKRGQGYAVDRSYLPVAKLRNQKLTPFLVPSRLDAEEISACIQELSDFLSSAQLPFPAADIFEYWLLDGSDESPLALIFSCCDDSQMARYPSHTGWTALPHLKMQIDYTTEELARSDPPVNHRLESLIAKRAGKRPRAAWFERGTGQQVAFPALLIREDWPEQAEHELCQRYLLRKSPRLLMLQGLSQQDRERLEVAAKKYAVEVDEFFPLYPEVNDESRMSALRVEARLRRGSPQQPKTTAKETKSGPTPLSKDLRILE